MPVSLLRIDRSFVSGVHVDIQDHALVSATIDLARSFGLSTAAAGVETDDQLADLTEQGCDYAQGYFWSPPTYPSMPGWSSTAWLGPRTDGCAAPQPCCQRRHRGQGSARS